MEDLWGLSDRYKKIIGQRCWISLASLVMFLCKESKGPWGVQIRGTDSRQMVTFGQTDKGFSIPQWLSWLHTYRHESMQWRTTIYCSSKNKTKGVSQLLLWYNNIPDNFHKTKDFVDNMRDVLLLLGKRTKIMFLFPFKTFQWWPLVFNRVYVQWFLKHDNWNKITGAFCFTITLLFCFSAKSPPFKFLPCQAMTDLVHMYLCFQFIVI